jgi:hypothetical protein
MENLWRANAESMEIIHFLSSIHELLDKPGLLRGGK